MDHPTNANPQENIFTDVLNTAPYEKSLKNARTWLYVIAACQFLMGLYEYFTAANSTIGIAAFGIDAIISAMFFALAVWSKKKPSISFTLALLLYIVFIIALMFFDTANIYRGLLIKILVIIALVKANKDAKKYEEAKMLSGHNL